MGSYEVVMGALAQVVGGTQPTVAQMMAGQNGIGGDFDPAARLALVTKLQPFWYSGADVGDSSGVTGVAGCFAMPTEDVGATPCGMVLPNRWDPLEKMPFQGHKDRLDNFHVRVLVSSNDLFTMMSTLVDLADSVPLAYDVHMQLFGTANVGSTDCSSGRFIEIEWGGKTYLAVEFTVVVLRNIAITRAG